MQQVTRRESFADRLARVGPRLSTSEARVAAHLAGAGPEILLRSAASLAATLQTSDATVLRAVRALGYSGLPELREEVAAALAEPAIDERLRRTVTPGSAASTVLASTIRDHQRSLELMQQRLDEGAFERAVDVLSRGRRVTWWGTGPSAHLAGYGSMLCARIGRPAAAFTQTGAGAADELLSLVAGDAVVVLAYGRVHRHVSVLLDRAREIGCAVVLITDTLGSRVADRVDVRLAIGRGVPGLFASHAATLVVIEAVVLAVAAANLGAAEDALRTLNALRASIAGRRIDVDPD
ncbi:MAG TPA: MurR/RpiR family transcriptional regulator [Ilumatobacteraceae bacterium]